MNADLKAATDIAHRIIRNGLAAGYTVSVNDGEEWPVKRSVKVTDIFAALASTDADLIRFRNAAGEKIGDVLFIYENGRDVLSNHTDNAAIGALVGRESDGKI